MGSEVRGWAAGSFSVALIEVGVLLVVGGDVEVIVVLEAGVAVNVLGVVTKVVIGDLVVVRLV